MVFQSVICPHGFDSGVAGRKVPNIWRFKPLAKDIRYCLAVWSRSCSPLLQRQKDISVWCEAGVNPRDCHLGRRHPVSIRTAPPGETGCVWKPALPVAVLSILQRIDRLDDVDHGIAVLIHASQTDTRCVIHLVDDVVAWAQGEVFVVLGHGEELYVLEHRVIDQEVLKPPSWWVPKAVIATVTRLRIFTLGWDGVRVARSNPWRCCDNTWSC